MMKTIRKDVEIEMFEQEELKKAELIKELIKGEKAGFVKNFNRDTFLNDLHNEHLSK